MDSYTTDFIAPATKISMYSSISICAVMRVVYINDFLLYLVLTLTIFSFSVL